MFKSRCWLGLLLILGFTQQTIAQKTIAPQLDHFAIYVADLQKSVAFYRDVFGFEQVPIPVTFAAWLSMGKGVMLHIVAGRKEAVANTKWDHLSIACEDMAAMTASLDARHIPWASMDGKSEPAVRFDGVKQIFIKDPDGYWIEINDALKAKPGAK
jgi:catechol 2,3-dioxygenase-like lactoylglutathione lyase family enzyme